MTNTDLALQGTVTGICALESSRKPGDNGSIIGICGVGIFGDNIIHYITN